MSRHQYGYDRRDFADIGISNYIESVDMKNKTAEIKIEKSNEEISGEIPMKWEVCPTCEGDGSHVRSAIDRGGITATEMKELGPEFRDMYFGGQFDRECKGCKGRRVVPRIDRDMLSEEQQTLVDKADETLKEDMEFRRLQMQERMMGA